MTWRPLLLLALVVVGATAGQSKEPTNACQGCRSIVSLARSLNSTTLRDQYADLLKNFCEQYYPPSTDFQQGPCPIFVQGLFYVMNNTDPVSHCDEIGVCGPKQPSDDIYDYIQSSNALAEKQPLKGDGLICDFCVNMVDQVRTTLTDPETIKKIYAQAQAFCSYLKVIDKEQDCQELMNKYLEYAVTIIKQINSREYCASINMCQPKQRLISNSDSEQGRRQLPTLADFSNFGIETAVSIGPKPTTDLTAAQTHYQKGPECALCKAVVKEMFRFLRNNKTEANIVKGLDRVCNLLYPSEPNLGQCKSMVKAYTREIVQLLVDETNPEVICMLLEQCTYGKELAAQEQQQPAQISTTKLEAPVQAYNLAQLITALDPSVGVDSMRSCIECKMFISYLRDKLGNPKSQAELKQWLLDNLCKELPEKGLVDSCSSMVEAYSDVFFKAIAGDLNPRIACVDLGACNASSIVHVFNLANGNEQSSRTSLLLDQTARLSGAARRQTRTKARHCTRCMDVVAFIDDYLAAHPLSQDTASSVSKVCDSAHSPSIRNECVSIMKQHGADVVQSIPTMESPRHLCKQIALC